MRRPRPNKGSWSGDRWNRCVLNKKYRDSRVVRKAHCSHVYSTRGAGASDTATAAATDITTGAGAAYSTTEAGEIVLEMCTTSKRRVICVEAQDCSVHRVPVSSIFCPNTEGRATGGTREDTDIAMFVVSHGLLDSDQRDPNNISVIDTHLRGLRITSPLGAKIS